MGFANGSIARNARHRHLIYSEADFEFFSPRRGDTLHRLGWNLATPPCQISPPSVQR